jgi:hypothetical protein
LSPPVKTATTQVVGFHLGNSPSSYHRALEQTRGSR